MDDFILRIRSKITEYGASTSDLVIDLAIEAFVDIRNYPASWTEERKLSDMERNISKIAMAAIEIDSKDGAENQLSHSENGISRAYAENLLAYRNIIGYVGVL